MVALSIGHATYDIMVPLENYPIENGKYYLKEKIDSSGGGASNVAFLLAKWNVETYFSGVVGYDDFGSFIKKDMEASGIKTSFLETSYDKKTSTSFILINGTNHTRTIFNIESEEFHLKKYEYDIHPDIVYMDGYEYSASTTAMNKYREAITVLDASSATKELIALARDAKYIIGSIEFAEGIAGMKIDFNNPVTLLTVYKRVKDRFPNNEIIITLKGYGALYHLNGEIKQMPPLNVVEIDRTGVGDIFRGAFLYAMGSKYDLETSIRLANITASLSTTKMGVKDSIPTLSEVIQNYESRFGKLQVIVAEPIPQTETPIQNSEPKEEPQEVQQPSQENQIFQTMAISPDEIKAASEGVSNQNLITPALEPPTNPTIPNQMQAAALMQLQNQTMNIPINQNISQPMPPQPPKNILK